MRLSVITIGWSRIRPQELNLETQWISFSRTLYRPSSRSRKERKQRQWTHIHTNSWRSKCAKWRKRLQLSGIRRAIVWEHWTPIQVCLQSRCTTLTPTSSTESTPKTKFTTSTTSRAQFTKVATLWNQLQCPEMEAKTSSACWREERHLCPRSHQRSSSVNSKCWTRKAPVLEQLYTTNTWASGTMPTWLKSKAS